MGWESLDPGCVDFPQGAVSVGTDTKLVTSGCSVVGAGEEEEEAVTKRGEAQSASLPPQGENAVGFADTRK